MSIKFSEAKRRQALASVQRFFEAEFDEPIGEIRSRTILDYFLTELAPMVYNQAISDAQTYMTERTADLPGVCFEQEFPDHS